MKTILIAGGSGLVGMRLSELLSNKGYKVCHLSRSRKRDAIYKRYVWNVEEGTIDAEALKAADAIINLAGAGIADQPWTAERKQLIIDSRVGGNELLAREIPKYDNIKAYVSASAIGFYGNRSAEEVLDEEAPAGDTGFLPESVIAWENAIQKVEKTGVRTVLLRVGIVLSTKGGALEKMLLPLKFGIGSYFGMGRQIYSWVHIDDICRMFIAALENETMHGVYNGVAPSPISNKVLMEKTRTVFNSFSLLLPVPEFLLRLIMGEMADVVFDGAKVSSKKIQHTGFKFQFPNIGKALIDLKNSRH